MNRSFFIGRVERAVRHALIAAGGEPVRFGDLMDRVYMPPRRRWYWPIHRALKKYGVQAGHGWWPPNAELMARIRGSTDRAPVGVKSETSDNSDS
jgi:hypothetical protein